MELVKNIIFTAFLIMGYTSCGQKQDPVAEAGEWKLIWSDEFSTDGVPDPGKWVFSGRRSPDWACYCTDSPENARVSGGKLILSGTSSIQSGDTARFNTGCIQTSGKFSFLYGKLEVHARLSKGQGSWPAIWLMPARPVYGGWPMSGEIDVMEHLNFDTIVYQTVHSDYIDNKKQRNNPVYYATVPFKTGEFNTYGLEWHPGRLDFFINGKKTFTYPKKEGAGSSQWPFDQEYYIILDQALGGKWPGPVNPGHLPVSMEIDWIRVYQYQN